MRDDDAIPPDSDLDDLPEKLRERTGPLWIGGVDEQVVRLR